MNAAKRLLVPTLDQTLIHQPLHSALDLEQDLHDAELDLDDAVEM